MRVIRAKRKHYQKIKLLLEVYGKCSIERYDLNSKDIGLLAINENNEVVGFIWCGLMSQGKVAYIDKFAVKTEYAGKGVADLLGSCMLLELNKRKVDQAFGVIKQDKYHDKSAFNALKFAMGASEGAYTFVYADLERVNKELKELR